MSNNHSGRCTINYVDLQLGTLRHLVCEHEHWTPCEIWTMPCGGNGFRNKWSSNAEQNTFSKHGLVHSCETLPFQAIIGFQKNQHGLWWDGNRLIRQIYNSLHSYSFSKILLLPINQIKNMERTVPPSMFHCNLFSPGTYTVVSFHHCLVARILITSTLI